MRGALRLVRAHSAVALALVMSLWLSTARADKSGAPAIPEASSKIAAGDSSQLPLPYAADDSAHFAPPPPTPERELPPPLARPREWPRRPFELAASLAVALPSCAPGALSDRGCATLDSGAALELSALYRVGPFFGVGAAAALAGFSRAAGGALSSAAGSARFFGVVGRVYFAEGGVWDPYVALTLGVGSLSARGETARGRGALGEGAPTAGAEDATRGFGGRVGGGLDFMLGRWLRVGPQASFARWLAWTEERCESGACRRHALAHGRLLGFATLGLQLTGSLGEPL